MEVRTGDNCPSRFEDANLVQFWTGNTGQDVMSSPIVLMAPAIAIESSLLSNLSLVQPELAFTAQSFAPYQSTKSIGPVLSRTPSEL